MPRKAHAFPGLSASGGFRAKKTAIWFDTCSVLFCLLEEAACPPGGWPPFCRRSCCMASVATSRAAQTARGSSKMDAVRELSKGLKVEARFCPADAADPFDTVQWELRSA